MAKTVSNNLVGLAGEYFVCAELCRRGFLALLAPKNNPLYDVIVSNRLGTKTVALQVKTRSNELGWKLGRGIAEKEGNPSLFVALVDLTAASAPDVWIYEYDVLAAQIEKQFAAYMARPKKDGTKHIDPGFRWHDLSGFTPEDHARKNAWKVITERLA